MRQDTPGQEQASIPHTSLYLIPAMGILTAAAIALIVYRERKWTALYVNRFNDLLRQYPRRYLSPTLSLANPKQTCNWMKNAAIDRRGIFFWFA